MSKALEPLYVFGVDLSHLSESSQLVVLACGHLFCALGFAALQEKVFIIEGFHYGGFMTFLTTLTYSACAVIERRLTNDNDMRARIRDYFVLSLFTMGGMYLTNWSLEYLNYPTRVVFKSSKVIPTMFVGVLVQHKSYSVPEYISAFVLVIGIVVFTLGDAKESPKFNIYGVLLISLGVIADALTSNLQEGKFFRKLKCSQAEVMLFCSLFGSLNALLAIVAEGSLFPAVNFAVEHPEMVLWTITFSTLGYCSVMFVLLLIKRFGATNAEIVKSCRKVFSILLSFFLYAKPISSMHFIGGAFFVGSVLMGVQIKARKQQKRQETSKPPAEDIEELLAKNAETRS